MACPHGAKDAPPTGRAQEQGPYHGAGVAHLRPDSAAFLASHLGQQLDPRRARKRALRRLPLPSRPSERLLDQRPVQLLWYFASRHWVAFWCWRWAAPPRLPPPGPIQATASRVVPAPASSWPENVGVCLVELAGLNSVWQCPTAMVSVVGVMPGLTPLIIRRLC